MNKKFNEWYIDVSLSPQDGQIEKRISVIESYAQSVRTYDIINLVNLYFDNPVSEDFINTFAKRFSDNDSSFSARYKKELQLLAGATLVEITEKTYDYDALSELLTIGQSTFHVPASSTSILDVIKQQFDNDRIRIRESDDIASQVTAPEVSKFDNYIEDNSWDDNAPNELISVLKGYNKTIDALAENINILSRQQTIYKEDSQLLWWMISCWSNELGCSLKGIEKITASLIIGNESACMVNNYPGPYSMFGVLTHILEGCKGKSIKVTLSDLFIKGNKEWIRKYHDNMSKSQIIDLLPLSSAILRANNTETLDEWYPKYKKEILRNDTPPTMYPAEYAWQMYLEVLAIRCYNDLVAKEK